MEDLTTENDRAAAPLVQVGRSREPAARQFDLAALRLVLTGESAVDAPSLAFRDRSQVDQFLRQCQFDTDNPLDLQRLLEIHHEATVYLTDVHRYHLPLVVEQPREIHDLFLATSSQSRRVRRFASMTLKVMHILQHIQGRELIYNTAISEAELFSRLSGRVFTVIDRMRASGVELQEFTAGKKSRTSLLTKLLSKRRNLASHVFDRLRFRLVVKRHDDLVQALLYLIHNLFPFNYVVPEQSQNDLISYEDIAKTLGVSLDKVRFQWERVPFGLPPEAMALPESNEFSGPTYGSVNFVADIPVRIDDVAPNAAPAIVFVQTEIQIVDADTECANNEGENAHTLYKKRQRERVRRRLEG